MRSRQRSPHTKKTMTETTVTLFCTDTDAGERLDNFILRALSDMAEETGRAALSRSAVQKIIENGGVYIDGVPAAKNRRTRAGEEIRVTLPAPVELDVLPQDIPLDIVYEDDDLLVVNKPKGMVVHPAPGNPDGTLVNALLWHCRDSLSGINGVMRPGIVHRIDKDTSGLLLVAKNDQAHLSLSEQIASHSACRVYNAVVHGVVKEDSGTIDQPIGRSEKDRKKYCVTDRNAKRAVTHYEVLRRFDKYTLLRLALETGRTHQIRVHMAHAGHPVAGDLIYGFKNEPKHLCGQCLHAAEIEFVHPRTGERMRFTSPLPDYFENFLNGLHEWE